MPLSVLNCRIRFTILNPQRISWAVLVWVLLAFNRSITACSYRNVWRSYPEAQLGWTVFIFPSEVMIRGSWHLISLVLHGV
jgi:hypothetical protein